MESSERYQLLMSEDGSHTVRLGDHGATFHSTKGAITESNHIFIGYGLTPVLESVKGPVTILEVGFGTGLNALLTLLESGERAVTYHAIEPNPLPLDIVEQLNYHQFLGHAAFGVLDKMHRIGPGVHEITDSFRLGIIASTLLEARLETEYDLVYFDPFDPNVQADLWTIPMFRKLHTAMKPGAILVTYSAKGQVRRDLQQVGFNVERLPGPPGKIHVTRATKV
jgi:tRNA U34 5-methylaminomethyl-2-thiouridine-forming methyltransferase MnmC